MIAVVDGGASRLCDSASIRTFVGRAWLIAVNYQEKHLNVIWTVVAAVALATICVVVPDVFFHDAFYDAVPKRRFGVAIGAILGGFVLLSSRTYVVRCMGLLAAFVGFVFLVYNVVGVAGWPWE